MNQHEPRAFIRLFALGAGTLDFLTGLGLVFTPALTMRLMGAVPPDAAAETYLRFLGVFVGAVGFSYLWALWRGAAAFRTVFELTIFFRLAAGAFCGWALLAGRLDPAWWSVPVTDFAFAATQAWLLRRGMLYDGP